MIGYLTPAQRAQVNALIQTSVGALMKCDHDTCSGCSCDCHNADEWDETAIDRLMFDIQKDQVKDAANRVCDLTEANSILKKDLRFWQWLSLCATVLAASLMAGIVASILWGR